jgi:hypothetical protein
LCSVDPSEDEQKIKNFLFQKIYDSISSTNEPFTINNVYNFIINKKSIKVVKTKNKLQSYNSTVKFMNVENGVPNEIIFFVYFTKENNKYCITVDIDTNTDANSNPIYNNDYNSNIINDTDFIDINKIINDDFMTDFNSIISENIVF